jgi:selenocysteine lyase/cysteine desulfurase
MLRTAASRRRRKAAVPTPDAALDLAAVQREFPIRKTRVYLNNASIAPAATPVVAAVERFMADVRDHGDLHYPDWCRHADQVIKAKLARLVGAQPTEIAFVKNTTEGLVIVANGLDWQPGDTVLVPEIEYPSNVYCWMNLARRGVTVKWIPAREGRILVDDIAALLDARTRLVTLSAVQFSNGFRQDLERTAELCQARGVLLNLDAIQYVGALPLDLAQWPIDFLSAGGHKWLLGPIGTGFFFCRTAVLERLRPVNVGYHSVAKDADHLDYELTFRPDAGRFEEALVNFPGLWGLEAAVDLVLSVGPARIEAHLRDLTARLVDGLRAKGYAILSPQGAGDTSGIVSFRHPTRPAEELQRRLQAAGVDVALCVGALRASPGVENDAGDVDALLSALP